MKDKEKMKNDKWVIIVVFYKKKNIVVSWYKSTDELCHEKTWFLDMGKQRGRSAVG